MLIIGGKKSRLILMRRASLAIVRAATLNYHRGLGRRNRWLRFQRGRQEISFPASSARARARSSFLTRANARRDEKSAWAGYPLPPFAMADSRGYTSRRETRKDFVTGRERPPAKPNTTSSFTCKRGGDVGNPRPPTIRKTGTGR